MRLLQNKEIKLPNFPPKYISLWCRYGTVMGGLLSEKFLDANINIPFAGPATNTPSLQKYKRVWYHNHHYLSEASLKLIIDHFPCLRTWGGWDFISLFLLFPWHSYIIYVFYYTLHHMADGGFLGRMEFVPRTSSNS
jgi:hypothetical protein